MAKPKLTPKQAKLVKATAMDPHATLEERGLRAGYSGRQQAYRALKAPAVVDAMEKIRGLMEEREKLSLGSLLTRIEEGLEATDLRSVKLDGDSMKPSVEVPDFAVRHKYLETALELRGLSGKKDEATPGAGAINLAIIFSGGGSELEKQGVADVLVAARLSRGLHPLENRKLTAEEAEQMRRTP